MNKLAALRLLGGHLEGLEKQHQQRVDRGDNPAEVDRETAQMALNEVVTFCFDLGIESRSLVRLLDGLSALSAGSKAPSMFAPAATRHRRPDAPGIEGVKGRLAAVMEFRQQAGLSRKAAADWVARHIPPDLRCRVGAVWRATVDSLARKVGWSARMDVGDWSRGISAHAGHSHNADTYRAAIEKGVLAAT